MFQQDSGSCYWSLQEKTCRTPSLQVANQVGEC
ncbi:hypothetical protein BFJ72_g698 [Fusarium proliferatum]|uniref:Uncharacterized protein n=1 Tax=Gibberella intermedia TaxID=948311 RepID=A0A420UBS8_GIBIN|nr:hypothetical protein BFJ72_g698 [Fusarium proliferatum]